MNREVEMNRIFSVQGENKLQSNIQQRKKWLTELGKLIKLNQHAIQEALYKDLKKHPTEAFVTEIFPVLAEIKLYLKKIDKWLQPNKVSNGILFLGARAYTQLEPKGRCLIISPWNYPFQLPIIHLIACLSAGNRAVIKPSEFTPNTNIVLKKILQQAFEENHITIVEGDAAVSAYLLSLPFDHIHFTGSTKVGKFVMAAAAKNLSSCTLELGGKSPAIIDDKTDLQEVAAKLVFGKFVNAGQTCIAPDYVLVPNNRKKAFIDAMQLEITKAFGTDIKQSVYLSRIINIANHQRIVKIIEEAKIAGANVLFGGDYDEDELYIQPTLITDIPANQSILQEEIFGPVLPIVGFDKVADAKNFILDRAKPLAMYLFSNQAKWINYFNENTSSGALVINEVLIHMMHPNLPFGGVNESGIGQSTGWYGLKDFSHEKPILQINPLLSPSKQIGFPYKAKMEKLLRFFT